MKERRSASVTQTAQLVLEPQVRRFPVRRYGGAALGVLFLGVMAVFGIREVARMEPILAAQGADAARAVLYELPRGGELHVPIEPKTDVIRFVVHAYVRGELPLSPRPVHLVVSARGDKGSRVEELRLDVPGLRTRVTPEERGLDVGDPMPFETDVHDLGVGELVVKLDSIEEADGLLVRSYRREQLSSAEAIVRDTALNRARKEELARWTWELGWNELTPFEREATLMTRWHKLGALPGATGDLRSLSVAMSPPPLRESMPRHPELLGRVPLRGDERAAFLLHPATSVRVAAEESTQLRLTVRDAKGAAEQGTAKAYAELGPFPDLRSVEVEVDRDVVVEVRASSASDAEWLGWSDAYRATKQRPVVVESTDAARVLRVTVRRPIDRNDPSPAPLDARVDVSGPNQGKSVSQVFRAARPRSRVDRYEDFDAPEAPSEPAAFFVALERGMTARIAPIDGDLDVSLAELDEAAPALPLATRPSKDPPPIVVPVTAHAKDEPRAFVPRRASNAAAFGPDAKKVVRTARWFAPAPPALPAVTLGHVKHGRGERVLRGTDPFEALGEPFEIDRDARRPLYLPISAFSDTKTTLTVQLDRDPQPPRPGLHERWTRTRTMDLGAGEETRATFVVGDDVPAGRLHIRITPERAADGRTPRVLVHLPWASIRPFGPRWIAGAFEE